MTLNTPEPAEARSEELVSSMRDTLKTMRQHFQAFIEEADAGEDVKETEVSKQLVALNRAIANLQGMEKKLDELRQARDGIVQNGYALNLDFARAEVRCALGRIRTCGGTRAVSE
ncbi:hypothetical protein [uncultured Tateyamaria sp.]|uniref:hypothetical protein n=1 Tax=uncultured Tateyamaria sp. TaxID=455651 RepID=UPI002617DD54|nr:hypothetical protein [uncultured Tateyamaria sp.]